MRNLILMTNIDFTSHFSGHETFALRYGWLQKAHTILDLNEKDVEQQVVDLGVGKNMVNSIKYWADVSGLVPVKNKENNSLRYTTHIGDVLQEYDAFLELNASIWLLHYFIQKRFDGLSVARWFFNYSNKQVFDKAELISDLINWLETNNLKVPSEATLKKDFDCFILCYAKHANKKQNNEDAFISPLNELGLIYPVELHKFKADFLEQKLLPVEVFLYCLVDFWQTHFGRQNTIGVDLVTSQAGSPGRLFRLNSTAIDYFLNQCAKIDSRFRWTDTLGVRSLACTQIENIDLNQLLANIYKAQ